MNKAWKAIAIGEFLVIVAGISIAMCYFAYKNGFIGEGVKSVIEVIANIAYLVFFFAGATGWMLLIGLWGGGE